MNRHMWNHRKDECRRHRQIHIDTQKLTDENRHKLGTYPCKKKHAEIKHKQRGKIDQTTRMQYDTTKSKHTYHEAVKPHKDSTVNNDQIM